MVPNWLSTTKKLYQRETMKSPKRPDQVDVQVGLRIRVQRQAIGMSQRKLGDALGVTFQQVQKYEQGKNRVGAGRLTKIASVLQVPVADLLGTDEGPGHALERQGGASSPVKLMTIPGALKLLRAYRDLSDSKMRRSVVQLVDNIAAGRGRSSRRV
jgi:transcriptional regulator with XRE-family HTH domain